MNDMTGDVPLLLAGSGRSGTTWVLDVLADTGGLRTIFEPLHPAAFPQAAPYADNYVAVGDEARELETLLRGAFDGSLRSVWTDYRVRPDRLRPTIAKLTSPKETYRLMRLWRKRHRHRQRYADVVNRPRALVKCIRANLMLGWIRQRFDARILLVLRHPGAVVESQRRLGGPDWSPDASLARYRSDPAVLTAQGGRFAELLNEDLSPTEGLTLVWCIQNQIPLAELDRSGAGVVFYEELFNSPREEWRRALDAMGLGGEPDWNMVARPSQQASGVSRQAESIDASHLGRWLERLDAAAIDEIDRVLRHTGVSVYAAHEPLPITRQIKELTP